MYEANSLMELKEQNGADLGRWTFSATLPIIPI